LSTQIGITSVSSKDIVLKDFFERKEGGSLVDLVVGLIGIQMAGELEAFVMIVNPRQQMDIIFSEQSLAQIGRVISNSIEKLTLGEQLEERVRVRTKDLEKEKVKAETANIDKSSFLSTMTNEIRTPFNGIIGMADLLQQGELDEHQSVFVKTILSSSRRLLDLLSGILDFSKLEAGGIEPNRNRVNLHASLKDLVTIAIQRNKNEGLEIQLQTEFDPGLYLECDEELIQRVIRGLIGNAIQHSNAQQIVVNVQASAMIDEHTLLTVAVTDDGVGINEHLLENLFEPFVQGETKVFYDKRNEMNV
jgi:signal transduction histidine kinase